MESGHPIKIMHCKVFTYIMEWYHIIKMIKVHPALYLVLGKGGKEGISNHEIYLETLLSFIYPIAPNYVSTTDRINSDVSTSD